MEVWFRMLLLTWTWVCGGTQNHLADRQAGTSGLCLSGSVLECCWGRSQVDRGRSQVDEGRSQVDWGQCRPICRQECKHGECVGPDTCKCNPGYTGKTCSQDLNECGLKPRPCKHRCVNTLGSFKCFCLDGHMLQPDGSCRNARTCAMVNCQYGCEVTKGEVRCQCPSPGLRLGPDKRTCVDVDECVSRPGVCPRRRKCVNTFGSFLCRCHQGFKLRYIDGRYTCIDKDTRPFCSLNPASPKCLCANGRVCKPVARVTLEPPRPPSSRKTTTTKTTTHRTPRSTTTISMTTPTTITTTTLATTTTVAMTTPNATTTVTMTTPITTTVSMTTPITITVATTSPSTSTTFATATPTTSIPTTTVTMTTPTTSIPTTTVTMTTPTTSISTTTVTMTTPTTSIPTTTVTMTTPTTSIPTTTVTMTTPTTSIPTTTTTTTTSTTTRPSTTTTIATTTTPATPPPLSTTTLDNHIQREVPSRPRGDVHIPRLPAQNNVLDLDIELGNTADSEEASDDPGAGLLTCVFDDGLCGWRQDGDVPWEITQNPAGGRYLSVPEGARSVRGARLVLLLAPPLSESQLCVSFRHWLTGHRVGVLQLFVKGRGQRYSPALWTRTGGHGWRHTHFTLGGGLERVLLKGERRRGLRGLIAVGDLSLRRGSCQHEHTQ